MFREVLQSMEGVGIWPTISLLVFVVLFVLMLVWVGRMDKEEVHRAGHLPLDEADRPEESLVRNREVS